MDGRKIVSRRVGTGDCRDPPKERENTGHDSAVAGSDLVRMILYVLLVVQDMVVRISLSLALLEY